MNVQELRALLREGQELLEQVRSHAPRSDARDVVGEVVQRALKQDREGLPVVRIRSPLKPGVVRLPPKVYAESHVVRIANSSRPEKEKTKFKFFMKDGAEVIELNGADHGRRIEGIASTPTMNTHGYSLSSEACKIKLPIPLLFSHGLIGNQTHTRNVDPATLRIGEIYCAMKSANAIVVRARLDDTRAGDDAWKLIQSGEARCFSGAADKSSWRLKGVVDGKRYYDEWTLREVSVCRKGANDDCKFWIVDDGV